MSTAIIPQGLSAPMVRLLELLLQRQDIQQLKEGIKDSERFIVEGVIRSARGPVWSALRNMQAEPETGPSLWVTPSTDGAEVLVEDLRAMGLDKKLIYFPFREERTSAEDARPVDPMQLEALERLQAAGSQE